MPEPITFTEYLIAHGPVFVVALIFAVLLAVVLHDIQ